MSGVTLLLSLVLLPLLAATVSALTPSQTAARRAWVAALPLMVALGASAVLLLVNQGNDAHCGGAWLALSGMPALELSLSLTPATWPLALTVAGVALAVAVYSVGYLGGERGLPRYYGVLGAFVAAMQLVVLSDGLLTLVLGWEGVGVASYFLIGFWHTRPVVGRAARLAILVNRIGDAALIGALGLGLSGAALAEPEWLAAALLVAAMAKSAQGPMALWLPEAMAGPTPVSALVHSATMVAAGIILLIKVDAWLTPGARAIALVVGTATALIGALSALRQTDLKRLLAQSTLSQLGFMLAAIGLGAGAAAQLHLLTHAAFKSALFLAAGVVIHALEHAQAEEDEGALDPQDLRTMGGLARQLPVTALCWTLCAAALAGLPLTGGAFSKEHIIGAGDGSLLHGAAQSLLLLTSALTAAYAAWATAALWWGPARRPVTPHPPHEPAWWMRAPLIALAAASLGYSLLWVGAHIDWVLLTLTTGAAALGLLRAATTLGPLSRGEWAVVSLPLPLPVDALARAYRWAMVTPLLRLVAWMKWAEMALIDSMIDAVAWVVAVPLARVADALDGWAVDGLVVGVGRALDAGGARVRAAQSGRVQAYLLLSLSALALALVVGWLLR